LFGITNITQGILGYWTGLKLIAARKYYYAVLNGIVGYFGMFFILIYGWDGLGYDRFYYCRDMIPGNPAWAPGEGMKNGIVAATINYVTSGVGMILAIDGAYFAPPLIGLLHIWYKETIARE